MHFLKAHNSGHKIVCLYDCDTNKQSNDQNNVFVRAIPKYANSKKMKIGIENALILDNIDLTPFYSTKVMESDLNETKTIQEFNKMEFCNHVCSLDDDILREVFGNLEKEINKLSALYNQ